MGGTVPSWRGCNHPSPFLQMTAVKQSEAGVTRALASSYLQGVCSGDSWGSSLLSSPALYNSQTLSCLGFKQFYGFFPEQGASSCLGGRSMMKSGHRKMTCSLRLSLKIVCKPNGTGHRRAEPTFPLPP